MDRLMPTAVGIVGLGAIGGSLALALREQPRYEITAWAASDLDRAAAGRHGVRLAESVDALARTSDIAIVAVPLDAIAAAARHLLDIAPGLTVFHTGSLQAEDAVGLDASAASRTFGAHPIAGTHGTGFDAARADLFRGALISIESRAPADARAMAADLWRGAGAGRIEVRDAAGHDALMAWVSHLPQLVSTALASSLAGAHVAAEVVGPGARDSTRLAQSAFAMWRPLLEHAPAETRRALRTAAETITSIEHALDTGDMTTIERAWEEACRWRLAVERA